MRVLLDFRKEIRKILMSSSLKAINLSAFLTQEKLLTFSTLITFVLMGGTLTASKVFVIVGSYQLVGRTLGLFVPVGVMALSESLVSCKRIKEYLLLDEFSANSDKKMDRKSGVRKEASVKMESFTGKWDSGQDEKNVRETTTLTNISVSVDSGQLLAVIGPVGCGKSSFLHAILRELPAISGNVNITGDVVYANQTPWVFSGTIRENILFGENFDSEWYEKVISACCLKTDLNLFPDGDLTLVGERGVTLSGGQKARVNLARAAYRKEAEVCLMDDPLSAVDVLVANQIFTKCISGLMKNKVRILVTHHLHLLKSADMIIILKEGKIAGRGSYDQLQAIGTDFASLLQKKEPEDSEETLGDFHSPRIGHSNFSTQPFSSECQERASCRSIRSASTFAEFTMNPSTEVEPEELREEGSVGRRVYLEYFRVGANAVFLAVFVLLCIANHVLYVMNDWWLAQWAVASEPYFESIQENNRTSNASKVSIFSESSANGETYLLAFDNSHYLNIYAVICFSTLASILLRTNMHFYLCVTSGIHMHNKMFRAILRAPVRFFDINPVGRILNRFSKDTGQVDELLPTSFVDFLFIFGIIAGVVVVVSSINYFVTIIVLLLVLYFIWLRRYYLRTSRDIKRLEGTSRSPVFSLLSNTLQGLVTVRAFSSEGQFEERFHECQDLNSAAWFLFLTGSRWFGIRLDFTTAIFTSTVAFACVIAASVLEIDSGDVGLVLTYCASTIGIFQWGVRQSAEVENSMTSVERIQQYYRIPPEAPDKLPNKKPNKDWPIQGRIVFRNVSFAYYKDGPMVLKNLNLEIKPKEKVGIVGRTGAGKSSLISAIFRLAELTDGDIYIDGVPISTIGLYDLRSALSIIPQDPILFSGTVRRNLDPFNEYKDETLWDALEQVRLKNFVKSLPSQLEEGLAESGSNFSVGQRQLVCLARAILRKSKILLIDEATANIDVRTDRLIQAAIRDKFEQCTVITIAHRINTVIDSDRLLVLDAGRIQEFDEPYNLLQNKHGVFSSLVQSTSTANADALRKAAKEAYLKKHNDESLEGYNNLDGTNAPLANTSSPSTSPPE